MSPHRSRGSRVVAISRSPAYSPQQHVTNDSAILEATIAELERLGWRAERVDEREMSGPLPPGEVCLNMAQGPAASRALLQHEAAGLRFYNRPSSVLRCHRQHLVPALLASGLPFPPTVLVRTDQPLAAEVQRRFAPFDSGPVWLKRGGVHAEREGDVRMLTGGELPRGLADLAARRIPVAAIQAHVPGPVVKFYGVTGGALFHAYVAGTKAPVTPDLVDLEVLRHLAFRAAARLRLDIFGGDVVIASPGSPVLIDLNDWPSFAPIRDRAARAIAGYVHAARPQGAIP